MGRSVDNPEERTTASLLSAEKETIELPNWAGLSPSGFNDSSVLAYGKTPFARQIILDFHAIDSKIEGIPNDFGNRTGGGLVSTPVTHDREPAIIAQGRRIGNLVVVQVAVHPVGVMQIRTIELKTEQMIGPAQIGV